jgi:4-cresol dehydrogenase (hydroxylating)
LLKGVPTDATLASAYWRKKAPPPPPDRMNPDADGCGLLWCVPVLPNTGADANAVASLTTDVVLQHGFEPQMSFSLISERSAICIATISYDREVPGDDERAMTCYRTLTEQLLARGYPPYRLNVSAMDWARDDSGYARMIRALKGALDPHGILAPGRYDGTAPPP